MISYLREPGVEQSGRLVGLITRRSKVQIPSPGTKIQEAIRPNKWQPVKEREPWRAPHTYRTRNEPKKGIAENRTTTEARKTTPNVIPTTKKHPTQRSALGPQ